MNGTELEQAEPARSRPPRRRLRGALLALAAAGGFAAGFLYSTFVGCHGT